MEEGIVQRGGFKPVLGVFMKQEGRGLGTTSQRMT